ncbi:MAG TPA: glycosyltransferase family 39 protein, partial [Aggregatilineales bacterium]|nr:glycosyltransferase family 39 protein [Aggregatilineales bacterium]
LVAILILQGIASMSLHNTAFQDEALYLYAGRAYFNQLRGGPIVQEPYGTYLSGTPFFYPLVAGALDTLGGLAAARAFSLACMLFATVMVYWTTRQLFQHDTALLAAALFAVQGVVIFLGWFATYDALCVALLALAMALAVRNSQGLPLLTVPAIGLILFVAVASKYAALLFVPPILALLFWQTLQHDGLPQAILHTGLALAIFCLCVATVLTLNADIRTGIAFTTTNRVAMMLTPRTALIANAVIWLGGVGVLAALGLFLLARKMPVLALIFFGAFFLAPAYHIYKLEITSMHKHMAFSFLFAAPLAGYALGRLAGYGAEGNFRKRWLVGVAILLLFLNTGVATAQGFYAEWTDSTGLINVLRTQVRSSGRILAEESEVPRYYLQDIVGFWQWNNLYWFDYTDKSGKYLQGVAAYKAALDERYWDLVVLRFGPSADVANAIASDLKTNRNYELLAKIPVDTVYGSGFYWVWRRIS